MGLPKNIIALSEQLSALPGIGPKLSLRLAMYLAVTRKNSATKIADALKETVEKIKECQNCFNVTESDLCQICTDVKRSEENSIMVVETPIDLYTIEESSGYKGKYHVLRGVISPVNGVGPDDLTITELVERCKEGVEEVIFGLNPTMEGDSTALYVKQQIEIVSPEISITRLAKGIPTGSSIEFMSGQTILDSLKSRDKI